MSRCLAPLALLAVVLGCAPAPQVGGEMPSRVYVRVVSLSPSTTELIAMLNSERLMIGRTAACDSPETIRNLPIMANPRPDIEKIVAFQADLVVVDPNLLRPDDLERLKEQRFEVFEADIRTVEDWKRVVYDLGNKFLVQKVASKSVDEVNAAVGRAKADPIVPKPTVLVAMGGDRPWVAGKGTFQADLIRAAGGEPLGPDGDRFFQVGPEQVLKWNPDFVFVSDDPGSYRGPAWAGTEAGRKNRVFGVNPDYLLRPGARVPRTINTIADELRRVEQ